MALALGLWIAVVAAAWWWGRQLLDDGVRLGLRAAPLYGRWDPDLSLRVLPAVALAVATVGWGPRVVARTRWWAVPALAAATTAAWAVALALVDGVEALTSPLESRHEYLGLATRVGDVGAFLDTFVERIGEYPTHVRGHPPGMVVVLAWLDRVGLGGSGWAAALVIAGGAVAVASTLVLTRELAGHRLARAAAPFLVLLPAAIWIASTADALFAGVGIGAVAMVAVAARRCSTGLALAAGVLLGAAVHLSYGLVLLAPAVIAVLARRWSWRVALATTIGGLAVTGAFLVAGFAWWEGLAATHAEYRRGIAAHRPRDYALVGNLAAMAIATGPAVVVGLVAAPRVARWVVVPALGAVAVAAASGLSTGEVERIWLFLVPPLAVSTAGLAPHPRRFLALQATSAVVLAILLRTPW